MQRLFDWHGKNLIGDSAARDCAVTLRVIVGPTGAGKSSLALQLAEARALSIVSADSRQVYAGFDIGTAKPSADEQQRVRHYGIDVLPPTTRYSAHAWAADADTWIRDASAQSRPPIIVGGTGFYVRALLAPFDELPPFDTSRREALQRWLTTLSAADIARWCLRLDPARAHLGRTQQLRAIETALLLGVRMSEQHAATSARARASIRAARYLVVDPGFVLAERIRMRVHAMLAAGWIDEVAQLTGCIAPDAPAWQASGYSAMRDHLSGALSRDAAIERIVIETRQYAKRQRTWFRHQLHEGPVTQLNPDAPNAFADALAWYDDEREEER